MDFSACLLVVFGGFKILVDSLEAGEQNIDYYAVTVVNILSGLYS